jgi:Glycosyltransferase family 87
MIARSESSFPRADPVVVLTAAAIGIALFALAWGLLHTGPFDDVAIVDTPVYQGYGDRIVDEGEVPYRDVELEYPPGALPAFVIPSLGAAADYDALFQLAMLVCGAAAVALVAVALAAAGVSPGALYTGVALAALSPLLLGPVILTRFDLWPALLLTGALAALASDRGRLGAALLAAAVATKLYALVVLPIALLYVWRRRGGREARIALAVFVLVLGLLFVPFLLVAPDGVASSFERQLGRPLQIESLGAGALLAADRLGLYEAQVVSSHGSQNLIGELPDGLATVQTVLQAVAVVSVWMVFARGNAEPVRLFTASAAAVAAFVAFGKVLSPQFLIWLLPLIPLVAGRRGLVPAGLLAGALLLTQLWFPYRYWDVVALEPVAWLVICRDVLLVALFAALVVATAREPEARGSP